jgi:hypothetical protein
MARYLRQALTLASLLAVAWSVALATELDSKIPAGTPFEVQISEKLGSETASVGDVLVAIGRTLFSPGANVTGKVSWCGLDARDFWAEGGQTV